MHSFQRAFRQPSRSVTLRFGIDASATAASWRRGADVARRFESLVASVDDTLARVGLPVSIEMASA